MDNLGDVYYLVQLIIRQILIFLRDFIFREFTWFAPTEEDLDDTTSKMQDSALHHTVADIFVLLAICGLLFVFTILSTNSTDEASGYGTSDIETISTAFEEDLSSFWYSRPASSRLMSYFHACGDSIGRSYDIVPKVQNISSAAISKGRASSRSRILNYGVRSSCSQKMQMGHSVSQTTPREWLIRHTRSGHVYGKYPI